MIVLTKCFHSFLLLVMLLESKNLSLAFSSSGHHCQLFSTSSSSSDRREHVSPLSMGLFDGIAKAFSNEEFKAQDQRVRASHILIKGDGDDSDVDAMMGTIRNLLGELQDRTFAGNEPLQEVFAELARRESQCPSKDQGGDLGLFGKGKMVKEFDAVLFPDDDSLAPPAGNIVGPVITEFGAHIIYVTKRDENKDQVEEKLARIDPDAQGQRPLM